MVHAYNGDTMNDHRMGIDIFNSTTSIPASEKAYYNVLKGTYPADHYVPTDQRINQLDTDVVRKSLGALIDYTFNAGACGAQAKAFALDGTGTHFQHTVTKTPAPVTGSYVQSWSSSMNPRR